MQLDYALAVKHIIKDEDKDFKRDSDRLDVIGNLIQPLGKALGVEYKGGKKQQQADQPKAMPDDLPVEDVLKMIGGKPTIGKHYGK